MTSTNKSDEANTTDVPVTKVPAAAAKGAYKSKKAAKEAGAKLETPDQLYAFLKRWSKGKPIVKQGDSSFHAAGKWQTRLEDDQIKGLVDAGFASYADGVLTLTKAVKEKGPSADQEPSADEPTPDQVARDDKRKARVAKAKKRNDAIRDAGSDKPKPAAKKATKKAATKQATKAPAKASKPEGSITLADIARELGVSPKIARAKMRRVDASAYSVGKHTYNVKDKQKVIDALQTDHRKK